MQTMRVACYSDASNAVIIQTPGRQFPGMVLQGDTLRTLYRKAERALTFFDANDATEAREYLLDVVESLKDRLIEYESVLQAHSLSLPYSDPVSDRT